MILRPYGGACYLYIGIGWPGLKKMGVKISEVLNLAISESKSFAEYMAVTEKSSIGQMA